MSRRAAVLLLTLCVLPGLHAHAAASGTVDAVEQVSQGDPVFAEALRTAAEQATRGDTLGAGIAYERLLQDPRLAGQDALTQSEAWFVAAQVARHQQKMDLAEQRFVQAVHLNPHNAMARLMLAEHELHGGRAPAAADSVVLALADTTGVPRLTPEFVWHLHTNLKDYPDKRLAVLQGLFDHAWTIEGVEPTEVWVILAALQAEAGQHDKIAATLQRIDSPLTLVALRSDKRFDRYIARNDPRFDPVAAARRHIDRLRVETMLSRKINESSVQLASTLLIAGDTEEVIGMTDRLATLSARLEEAPAEGGRYLAWMLDTRAVAQRRLGKIDDAVSDQMLAVRVADPRHDPVSQNLNLARLYVALHRPALARQALGALSDMSSYGEGARDVVALRAALQLKDNAAAQQARDGLAKQREANPGLYREGLIADNRQDEVAASLIAQLQDPIERISVLQEMQDLLYAPTLPAEVEQEARWKQVKQRADVLAAVNKVGRIDSYPLYAD